MSDFKLIAIRPLKGCDKRFSKNLEPGEVYKFYNDYTFTIKEDIIQSVTFNQTSPEDLYSIHQEGREDPISVNISAIVGKNGSGKSTLLELLYVGAYVISSKNGILEPNIAAIDEELGENDVMPDRKEYLENIKKEIEYIYETLKIEIYYTINSSIFCVLIDKDVKQSLIDGTIAKQRNYRIVSILDIETFDFDDFFYSIAVNYSIYGLNSIYTGEWIESLFHKNDGYQTPIVINPMRDEGKIDINNETHLAQSRLLANLVDDSMQVKEVLENKIVDRIDFEIDDEKLNLYKKYMRLDKIIDKVTGDVGMDENGIFDLTYNAIIGKGSDKFKYEPDILHLERIKRYVIKKLVKIASTYDEYDQYYIPPTSREIPPSIKNLPDFLAKLVTDNSHITLKLKQILNTVRFNLLREENNGRSFIWQGLKYSLPLNEFIDRIKTIKDDNNSVNILELIPGALFNPTIHIANSISPADVSKFHNLSSGEQQFVHSIQSILYHLINLNSVFNSIEDDEKLTFRNINIILDEIELYFHPEFQRKLITELIRGVEQLKIDNIKGINIICLTHSPFILSDIPVANSLRLDNGKVEPTPSENTFGANIHDLLADDFFMNDGFMGEFAKRKIEDCIRFLNYYITKNSIDNLADILNKFSTKSYSGNEKNEKEIYEQELINLQKELPATKDFIDDNNYQKKIIELVGEPVIRKKLEEMFHDAFRVAVLDEENAKKRIMEIALEAGIQVDFKAK